MFVGHLHSLCGFSMLFRASRERIEMYKDLNWSASLIVLFSSIQCFICFSTHVVKDLKHWKKRLYCPFSKWMSFSQCGHCDRIFKLQLTLDGLRMA